MFFYFVLNLKHMKNLTQRQYLGRWNFHIYKNTVTGEIKNVECSDEEYKSMGGVDGYLNNPKPIDDFVWVGRSVGGAIKIDTPDFLFGVGDWTIVPDEEKPYFLCHVDEMDRVVVDSHTQEEFEKIKQ